MSAKKIRAFAKRKGFEFKSLEWGWIPEPGESVACWSCYIDDAYADKFGTDNFVQFVSTQEVLDWIGGLRQKDFNRPSAVAEETHLSGDGPRLISLFRRSQTGQMK